MGARCEAKTKRWNNVDWLLQDVHYEEALGYRGVSSLTSAERAARQSRAEMVVGDAMSFFPGTEVEVLPPRPQPLRLRRLTGGTEKKRKAVSVAGSVQAKKTKRAPPRATVSVGGACSFCCKGLGETQRGERRRRGVWSPLGERGAVEGCSGRTQRELVDEVRAVLLPTCRVF
jgi:hypothetical protein